MKDANLQSLEQAFVSLQMSDDVEKSKDAIKRLVNRLTPYECVEVIVTQNDGDFFGMCTYPNQRMLDRLAADIIEPEVNKNILSDMNNEMQYIIEIDSKALTDKVVRFTPAENVAMLLHEVGHVRNYVQLHKHMKLDFVHALSREKMLAPKVEKDFITTSIAKLYILDYLDKFRVNNRVKQIEIEKAADQYVVDMGYAADLGSVLDKIAKHYKIQGTGSADTIGEAIAYARIISVCKTRRTYVMETITNEKRIAKKSFVKRILDGITSQFSKMRYGDKAKMTTHLDDMLQEGFLKDFFTNPIRIKQKDIDELRIDYEMLEDYDDKMCLMYKIHKRLTQLADSKEKIDPANKNMIELVADYNEQLIELLNKVMAFKVTEKTYGVFIKYPKGYEG